MTVKILVFVFFVLFFVFLAESIYFLKKKSGAGIPRADSQENNHQNNLFAWAGGILLVLLILAGITYLFLPKSNIRQQTNLPPAPVVSPSPVQPSPVPTEETVQNIPAATEIFPSPTLITIVTAKPTRTPIPTTTVTMSPKVPTVNPTTTLPIGGPDTSANQVSVTASTTPTSGPVIIPKTPVAGSAQYTFLFLFIAISTLFVGLVI